MLSRLKTALRALMRRTQVERELDEELRYHIERQTEQNVHLGMNPEEARRFASSIRAQGAPYAAALLNTQLETAVVALPNLRRLKC
jgi:hypothetical protein